MEHVRGAIIRTLAFNAAWGYAPTRLQLAMGLDVGAVGVETPSEGVSTLHIPDVWSELDRMIADGTVIEREAHLALAPYAEQIDQGRERESYFPRKLRRARWAATYISRLPWARAVCLCNTTALGQARDQGDLDFFVVAKAGTIWRTRFFATFPFKLFGARPSSSVIPAKAGIQNPENKEWIPGSSPRMTNGKDPVCLSFFVTDDALDLTPYMLAEDDPYFRHWFLSWLPLRDDGVLQDFWKQNASIRQRHPLARQWTALDAEDWLKPQKSEPAGNSWLEGVLKRIQMKKFPQAIKDLANQDTRVAVTDQALKFHVDDKRVEFRERYFEICRQYGIEP